MSKTIILSIDLERMGYKKNTPSTNPTSHLSPCPKQDIVTIEGRKSGTALRMILLTARRPTVTYPNPQVYSHLPS